MEVWSALGSRPAGARLARLKRSPDRADAVALAVYKPATVRATYESLDDVRAPRRAWFGGDENPEDDRWLNGHGDLRYGG